MREHLGSALKTQPLLWLGYEWSLGLLIEEAVALRVEEWRRVLASSLFVCPFQILR